MERKDKEKPKDPQEDIAFAAFMRKVIVRTLVGATTIMLFLALISYNPEDTHILDGGIANFATISNYIGKFGAYVSSRLIFWIGFAAYIGVALSFVCLMNRIVNQHAKPWSRIYLGGIVVFIWGCAMLLGVFPDLLPHYAERLNIAQIPGGVIGQRFCAPWSVGRPGGWLANVVNPTGSIIISSAMIIVGLVTIWYFDWRDWMIFWKERAVTGWRERQAARQAAVDAAPSTPSPTTSTPVQEPEPDPEPELFPEIPDPIAEEEPVASPAPVKPARTPTQVAGRPYKLPGLDLLNKSSAKASIADPQEVESKKRVLQDTLDSFGIDAQVGDSTSGPRVTLFEIKPAPGVKVEKISSLANNISMNLKAESLRILTPIPGKDTVGIEVPNRLSSSVSLRGLLDCPSWKKTGAAIPLALGKSISGKAAILDLAKAPHLLIAGATGSGKSVCMNTIILSLLYRFSPEQLKLIMVDPKVVEFSGYNSLPHLVTPVVTAVKKVPAVLRWALNQMEWRYDILSKVGVRNLAAFNARPQDKEPVLDDTGQPVPQALPFIVIIIDELADIMMTAKADVETSLARLAQLARAVGIHVIVATQRPSVNVITGIIKANFPTRIAFQVTSVVDSRTILDGKGAEALLGRGDMLFKPPGGSRLERTQGAMVDDDEIERVVGHVSAQAEPQYLDDILTFGVKKDKADSGAADAAVSRTAAGGQSGGGATADNSDEALLQRAIEIILRDRRATTSHVQRRLRIGYNRAALIIEQLEQQGVIGPQIGTAPRQILINEDDGAAKSTAAQDDDA